MKYKLLKEFCDINMGQSPDSKTYNEQGYGLPFYQGNADFGKIHPKTRIWCSEPVKKAEAGDILISVRAPIGAMNIANEKCCIGRGVAALTPKEECDKKYLYYALESKVKELMLQGTGSTFKAINKKILEQTHIPKYDIDKQRYVAHILGKVDLLIDKKQQQIEKISELVKSRFIEMFGDPDTNEKGWKINTFGEICSVRQGLQIPISKRLTEYEDDCYEYITVQYLHGGKEREYIKNPKSTVICTKDDILMTRTGNTGMVVTGVDGVFHNNFFLIDFDRNKYDKDFLIQYLKLDIIQADILRRAGTSTIPDLNHGEFYKIKVFEPPIELQDRFKDFLIQTDKSKLAVQKSLDELETLKKSLMQEYFG